MFEFLFKYPATVFSRGQFVFLAPWPAWLLGLAIVAAAGALAWHVSRNRGTAFGRAPALVWLLETALVALVLVPPLASGDQHRNPAPAAERRGCAG